MHRNVKRFGMDGEVADDSDFARLRSMYEKMITEQMRDEGYVPLIGYGPFWSTSYDVEKDNYKFLSSVHGIYVGRKKSWEIQGITVEDRIIPFRITLPKSKESYEK
jgi:hypothetical protein